jgi:hypothetical protein
LVKSVAVLKAVRAFGVLVAFVQLASVIALGASLFTIFSVASSAASGEAMTMEMTIDKATGVGVLTLEASPMNNGFLAANIAIDVGMVDEEGSYIARDSTSVSLGAGEQEPLSLSLTIPADVILEVIEEDVEGYFEVTLDIRTLYDMVSVTNTMRIRGGEPR